MSFSAYQMNPRVVVPGGASVKDNTYRGVGSVAMESGNLIRINTGGTISLALDTAVEAGAVHGMFLSTGYETTGPTTSQLCSILKFGADTEFQIQLYAAAGGDAQPQDVTVGLKYRTARGNSYDSRNRTALDAANADGPLLVTAKVNDAKWFESDYDVDTNFGIVQCRVTSACIDAFAAA